MRASSASRRLTAAAGAPVAVGEVVRLVIKVLSLFSRLVRVVWNSVFIFGSVVRVVVRVS